MRISLFLLLACGCCCCMFVHGSTAKKLDPNSVPKFASPLPLLKKYKRTPQEMIGEDGKMVTVDYRITMTEFKQQTLPRGFPLTTKYGFVGLDVEGNQVNHAPGHILEVYKNVGVAIAWCNNLTRPHMFPVDPTIAWANPREMPTPHGPSFPQFPSGYRVAQSEVPTVVHVHGGETDPRWDGPPEGWWTHSGLRGRHYHTFANAGPKCSVGYYSNAQLSGWRFFHDHTFGMTRLNVGAGLAGFWHLKDSADQVEPQLPHGEFGPIPIQISEHYFSESGDILWTHEGNDKHPYWEPEQTGDIVTANGVAWPFLEVKRGAYRLVLFNNADSRWYDLAFKSDVTGLNLEFSVYSTGHAYLEHVYKTNHFLLAPSGRIEIVIDFSSLSASTNVTLVNTAPFPYPDSGPAPNSHTGVVMQFRVVGGGSEGTWTDLQGSLFMPPQIKRPDHTSPPDRMFVLRESEVGLSFNDLDYSYPVTERPRLNSVEMWAFINPTPDAHPIHVHLVTMQVLSHQSLNQELYMQRYFAENGGALNTFRVTGQEETKVPATDEFVNGPLESPRPWETGMLDTVNVLPGTVTRVFMRWASVEEKPFPWVYRDDGVGHLLHCHMLSHEDNMMMRPLLPSSGSCTVDDLPGQMSWPMDADEKGIRLGYRVGGGRVSWGLEIKGATWMALLIPRDAGGRFADVNLFESRASATDPFRSVVKGTRLDAFATDYEVHSTFFSDTDRGGQMDVELRNSYMSVGGGALGVCWKRKIQTLDSENDVEIAYRTAMGIRVIWGTNPSGTFDADYGSHYRDGLVTVSDWPRHFPLVAHALLMSLAFGLFLVLGILTSTFGQTRFPKSWLAAHVGFQTVALCLMGCGFIIIVLHIAGDGEPHFVIPNSATSGAHGVLGLILVILMCIQVLIGISSELYWRFVLSKMQEPATPLFPQRTHWWLGRFVVVLSVVVIFLGIAEAYLAAWVFGLFALYYLGLFLLCGVLFFLNRRGTIHPSPSGENVVYGTL